MPRTRLILIILLCISARAYSQGTIPMNKKVFREEFTQGNLMLMEHFYDTALTTFLHIREMDTTNANVNYKVGLIYLQTHTKKYKAERYLLAASEHVSRNYLEDEPSEKNAPELVYYYLAKSMHINNEFNRAIDYYDKMKEVLGKKNPEMQKDIEYQKERCFTAIEIMKNPVLCKIVNLGDSVNSEHGDYSPVISADENVIMFTSNRKGTGIELTPENDYFEDIWICFKKPDGTWTKARSVSATINSTENEATIGLSADGQQLFIYKDDNGDGNIYRSELNGDIWSSPEKMGEDNTPKTDINTTAWEPSATITADGNTLYFVSDRKGGFGGTDIYRVVRLPNGNWSMAQNLGPTINSPYDEDAPFMHPDGRTLYFSSKGHKNMGGYDIFYSTRFDSGWSQPQNVGYPINTADDDVFYVTSPDGKRAYFSSVRPGGMGDKDIYRIDLKEGLSDPVIVFKGKIQYNGGDSLPPGVNIRIRDIASGDQLPDIKPNPKSRSYILLLSPGKADEKNFEISYEADSLDPVVENVKVERKNEYSETEKTVELKTVNFEKVPKTILFSGTLKGTDGLPVEGGKVYITDNKTDSVIHTLTPDPITGKFSIVIKRLKNYNVSFEAQHYLFQSINLNVPSKTDYREVKKDIVLEKIKLGVKITLNNIFFDSGKSDLRPESNSELEKMYKLMMENPSIRFEISGHTDNKGKDALNIKLSQARAQAVVNYLVKKGISKKKLIAKGYGKSQPVFSNNNPDGSPNEDNMQKNRRVEMKVIE